MHDAASGCRPAVCECVITHASTAFSLCPTLQLLVALARVSEALFGNGESCSENYECASDNCNYAKNKICTDKVANGDKCGRDRECASDYCTGLYGSCADKKQNGGSCEFDNTCVSGYCTGDTCQVRMMHGQRGGAAAARHPPTTTNMCALFLAPSAQDKKPNGRDCSFNSACISGYCTGFLGTCEVRIDARPTWCCSCTALAHSHTPSLRTRRITASGAASMTPA